MPEAKADLPGPDYLKAIKEQHFKQFDRKPAEIKAEFKAYVMKPREETYNFISHPEKSNNTGKDLNTDLEARVPEINI